MNQGFIKLPREFLQSRKWLNLNLISRTIFLILLEHATYEKRTFNNLGKDIHLNPGDICISRKRLLELCPKGITEKQLRVSIINLNRTNFCKKRAKERAKETDILTICDPMIYDACFLEKGQTKGQAKGQRRAKEGPTNKEREERKEDTIRQQQPVIVAQEGKVVGLINEYFFVKKKGPGNLAPHKVSRMQVHEEASKLGFYPGEIDVAIEKAISSNGCSQPMSYILGILNKTREEKNNGIKTTKLTVDVNEVIRATATKKESGFRAPRYEFKLPKTENIQSA